MVTLRTFITHVLMPAAALVVVAAGCMEQHSVAVNSKAPTLSLTTTDGASWSLEEFRGKKIVVLGVGNPFG
jgi:hypothetical protein